MSDFMQNPSTEGELILTVDKKAVYKSNIDELEKFINEKIASLPADCDYEEAKKNHALINKTKEILSRKRIDYTKAHDKQDEFAILMSRVKKLEKALDKANDIFDGIIKKKDDTDRQAATFRLQKMWEGKNAQIPFDLICKKEWYLKSATLVSIDTDMNKVAHNIDDTLVEIDKLVRNNNEKDIIKGLYLSTLDLSSAVQKTDELFAKVNIANNAINGINAKAEGNFQKEVAQKAQSIGDTFYNSNAVKESYTTTITCTECDLTTLEIFMKKSKIEYSPFEKIDF